MSELVRRVDRAPCDARLLYSRQRTLAASAASSVQAISRILHRGDCGQANEDLYSMANIALLQLSRR